MTLLFIECSAKEIHLLCRGVASMRHMKRELLFHSEKAACLVPRRTKEMSNEKMNYKPYIIGTIILKFGM